MHKQQRIIIAGGGTGGHIFPAIAIANALKEKDKSIEILFVGAKGKMEMEKVPKAGFRIEGLDIAGYNRSSLIKNIGLPLKLIRSFLQVKNIFRSFRPTAVIGVGGYSSFPVLRFAQSQGIPTFIHESNAFAGKSNIMLGRRATRVFTATTGMEKFFPADKILVTGNPVRAAIVQQGKERDAAIQAFGLDPQKKTILSMGGSLGAQHINEAIAAHIAEFANHDLQLIWQTGKPFQQQASQFASGMKNIYVCDFITDMDNAYAAADLVISRSGAMAIAELCVVKKPVVFVPYPFAAEDHQTMNAQQLVNAGAGEMIADKDALHKLVPAIIALAKDEQKQENMKQHIGQLAVTNADSIIATEILNILDDRS